MILPLDYWMIGIAMIIYLFAVYIMDKNPHIIAMAMILLMLVGIDIMVYGIESIINLATKGLGMILTTFGFFMLILSYYNEYKEAF